jgi:hypothetical protein
MDEADRKPGTAVVRAGVDGKVYGWAGGQYYRMLGGQSEKIDKAELPTFARTGALGWGVKSGVLPDKRTVSLDLPERYITVTTPEGKETRHDFEYQSGGAAVSSLVAGPDGMIYGSTNHPMHFFRYDPHGDKLTDLGPVARVGGGNFCAMDTQGQYIAASSYSYGIFHLFDTTRPFNGGFGEDPNPRELAEWKQDICRPRATLAHPDGKHLLMAGFAGYGFCGGGLGLYNLDTEEATLITHENLIPNESTIALKALPDGNIIGGTSISAPGGGHTTSTEGTLWIMDWATKKVVFRTNPVPGAAEIVSLLVGPDGLVYGVASGGKLFAFDPQQRQVVQQADLSEYGGIPRSNLVLGPDNMIYAIFGGGIVKIEPGTLAVTKLADTPMGVGAAAVLKDGRLYFASGANLWSYDVPGLVK